MFDLIIMVATAGGLFYWAQSKLPKRRGKTQDNFLFWAVLFLIIALYGM